MTPSKKYPLENGFPCKAHSCIKCCMGTEMPLTRYDITQIMQLGYKLEDFAVKTRGSWKLKNRHGKCVFLRAYGCSIYPHRPLGCRLYPLVYDENTRSPVLDNLCPYRHQFRFNKKHIEKLFKLIRKPNHTTN